MHIFLVNVMSIQRIRYLDYMVTKMEAHVKVLCSLKQAIMFKVPRETMMG